MDKKRRCNKHTWGGVVWGKVTCTVCGHHADVAMLDRMAHARVNAKTVKAIRAREVEPVLSTRKCKHCGEPEERSRPNDLGWFDTGDGRIFCNVCGQDPIRK